jgi:Mlc titration factor MtfA (ptsG expression regulator)
MDPALLFLLVVAAILGLVVALPRIRRRRLLARPFPPQWQHILQRNLPVYDALPDAVRTELHHQIVLFLDEKKFYGCGGLAIDDTVRVTIAAQACLLLLNRATSGYAGLQAILVYPAAYLARQQVHDHSGVVHVGDDTMLGESWSNGRLILSWDDVESGARNFHDGHNVVLHEFAHQLDQESGSANGAPLLGNGSSYQSWARVLADEFLQLQRQAELGQESLLDHYGASNPAEFFAVATEAFFERPGELRKLHPDLFEQLHGYYRVDPSAWHPAPCESADDGL